MGEGDREAVAGAVDHSQSETAIARLDTVRPSGSQSTMDLRAGSILKDGRGLGLAVALAAASPALAGPAPDMAACHDAAILARYVRQTPVPYEPPQQDGEIAYIDLGGPVTVRLEVVRVLSGDVRRRTVVAQAWMDAYVRSGHVARVYLRKATSGGFNIVHHPNRCNRGIPPARPLFADLPP